MYNTQYSIKVCDLDVQDSDLKWTASLIPIFCSSWLLQINHESTRMGSWHPPLSCYHADHTQLSVSLHKVNCFHVLWDKAILSFNEPYAYKVLYIIKNNLSCIYAFLKFLLPLFQTLLESNRHFTLRMNFDTCQFLCSQLTTDIKTRCICDIYIQ